MKIDAFLSTCCVVLAVALSSCVSTTTLYQGLTASKSSLKYLQDSPVLEKAGPDTININTPKITDSKFTFTGHLRNIKQTAVPLLVFNSWLSEHEYHLGQIAIKEDVADFVRDATIQEVSRMGNFYAFSGGKSELSLEIDVDSIHVSGVHSSSGYFVFMLFFYAYEFQESGKAGQAFSSFSYRLKRGDEIILAQKVKAASSIDPFIKQFKNKKAFRTAYSNSLVEALSLTFKENIETMIGQVNVALEKTAFREE